MDRKSVDHEDVVRQVVARLHEQFPNAKPDNVEAMAREELDALWQRPVRDYLIILTERAAKKRLKNR